MPEQVRAVYVVTSQGQDTYAAMTRVSAGSLRATQPGIVITLACEQSTWAALKTHRNRLLDEVDEVHLVATPPGSATFRNRFIKTQIRLSLDGPLLFLDSDILVRKPLSTVFETQEDLALARNHSRPNREEQVCEFDRQVLSAMQWSACPEVYANGGMIFYRDTPGARRFAERWHALYLEGAAATGQMRDQPSLNTSLATSGASFRIVPDCFNCQLVANPKITYDAAVWHYYLSADRLGPTEFERLSRDLRPDQPLDALQIERMIRCRHPYRQDMLLSYCFGQTVCNSGFADSISKLWLSKKRFTAVRRYLGQHWRALRTPSGITPDYALPSHHRK
jgi:hypothetical protein